MSDYTKHFIVGLAIGSFLGFAFSIFGTLAGIVVGLGVAFIWGFWKEIKDQKTPGNKFDVWDLVATTLGGFVGAVLAVLVF